jgi:hypothetical protein
VTSFNVNQYTARLVVNYVDGTEKEEVMYRSSWDAESSGISELCKRQRHIDAKGNRFTNSGGRQFHVTYRLYERGNVVFETESQVK